MSTKKISELNSANTISNNDLMVIVADPGGVDITKKISFVNFANSIVSSNLLPVATTSTAGIIKVDGTTITISNGTISGASIFNQQLNTTNNVTFASVITSNVFSQNSVTIKLNNGTNIWTYKANGELSAGGNIIPSANDVYTLGNSSLRWAALWVGGNSIIFADTNNSFPDQVLTVSNGIFNITQSGIASTAGLRVGNFTLVGQSILLANTYANIEIGTIGAVAPINFNRPINVRSVTGVWDTFSVDTVGRVDIISDIIENPDKAAFSVTSSRTRSIAPPNNDGVLIQISGSSVAPTRFYNDSYGTGNYSAFIGRHARGPTETPTQTMAGDTIARFGANPYGTSGFSSISTSRIDLVNRENQTDTTKGSEIQFWTTANNSTNIVKRVTINEDGFVFNDGSKQNTAFSNTNAVTKINVGVGLSQTGTVGNVSIDSTGVLSVTGTTNQVIVANTGQNIVLSLPQNIHANASVTFQSITVNNFTVTGSSTVANDLAITDKVIKLAVNSTTSAQISGGGITLGNTDASYHVSFLYDLTNDRWDTDGAGLKTLDLFANVITANTLDISENVHFGLAYLSQDYPNAIVQIDENINSYGQMVIQNHNNGTISSTDIVVTNDQGNDSSYFIDMGINSSTYDGTSSGWFISGPNDSYLYAANGNLTIGTSSASKVIKFHTGGTATNNIRAILNDSGLAITGNVSITSGSFVGNLNGTANNTNFVGLTSAANVVSNAQLQANLVNYQTTASLSANVLTLTSNSANYIGSLPAANVVSNAQLQANLVNYQTTAGLSANVLTLTSNSANYIGSIPSNNVVTGTQLSSNLANYVTGSALTSTLSGYASLTSNNIFTGNVTVNSTLFTTKVSANNSLGATGQVLTSNGNGTYWSSVSGVDTNAQYTFTNTITFSSSISVNKISANGIYGSNGQVLVANSADGMYWTNLKTHKTKKVKHKDGSFDPDVIAVDLQDTMTFVDGVGITMNANTADQTITINATQTIRDAGSTNALTIDFAVDEIVIFNPTNTSTITLINYSPGKKIEVWAKCLTNKAITHGALATQATGGLATSTPTGSNQLLKFNYLSTTTLNAGVYCSVTKAW